ncbi:hypothetical protein WDW86_21355 [Bdellovibrionota bacterium FG-2]
MRGFIFISKQFATLILLIFLTPLALNVFSTPLLAQDGAAASAAGGKTPKVYQSEEDDFATTPFTEYGEFNEQADEDADTKFLQFGRFFGVSLGLGAEGITGNRGLLWNGGFPLLDFKVHYWFDFNFAIDIGFFTVTHFYETTEELGGHVDVPVFHIGADLKYYFDTKNLSAALSFANPYVLIGIGNFSKTENSYSKGTSDPDSGFGMSAGGGLEFVLKARKTYLEIEGKVHLVNFKDTHTGVFNNDFNRLDDLTGVFYTVSANLLFTW